MSAKTVKLKLCQAKEVSETCVRCAFESDQNCTLGSQGDHPLHCGRLGYWKMVKA